MARKLDYRWHLRQVMAERGMFATTDLIEPLAQRGIRLSSSQVYRLVVERPERLSLKILMALLRHPGLRDGRADRTGRRGSVTGRQGRHRGRRRRRCRRVCVPNGPGSPASRADRCRRVRTRVLADPIGGRWSTWSPGASPAWTGRRSGRRRARSPAAGPNAAAWPRPCSTGLACSSTAAPRRPGRSGTC